MSLSRHIAPSLAVASLILLVLCLYELAVVGSSVRWWALLALTLSSWPISAFLRLGSYRKQKVQYASGESPILDGDNFLVNPRAILTVTLAALIGTTMWLYRAELSVFEGDAAFRKGDYEHAIDQYTSAIESDLMPDSRFVALYEKRADAWNYFATGYALGDEALIKSLNDYSRSQDMNPNLLSVIYGKAEIFRALGAYEESIGVLNRAIEIDGPKPFRSLIRRAQTYRAAENYDAALADLDRLIEIWGDIPSMMFHYHRGRLFMKMGRYSEAVESFTTGIPAQTNYAWAYIFRACANARLGNLASALNDFKRGVDIRNGYEREGIESPGTQYTNARLTAELESLRQIANGNDLADIPPDKMCEDGWDWGDKHRERSPIL